mmetsp:Transcript_6037/g.19506  ORF Transcript_6037/g.19506 Transcript_6037/m.19506 type:complete len:181 (+) Transcript_6037:48-590(+)|eukprot:CAMPEP_0113668238 /NCGR_PEP_ID=MMETSP0038_2-20120614/3892_1 /TAXON_ID=2898 /ORGANISM="Cryptomonas paramecium" /LENGTH=180 /DNA_ID=CAMNT_0000583965 /DNA_START=38 /DNA_END=580 /DNA_ORIENTATION=+ /assembly_acc=CAM_ASM_000170
MVLDAEVNESPFEEEEMMEDEGGSFSTSFGGSFSSSFVRSEPSVLLLTNHAHNKVVRPSPRRHYPFRGVSSQTSKRVFFNVDTMHRLLLEFSSVQDLSALRKTNNHLKTMVDAHPMLWKNIQFSPPGLSRVARLESALAMEKVLRKGAEGGNVEAQMMLALMYHHGYRCPCHALAIPGEF